MENVFPRKSEDKAHLQLIEDIRIKPVFVMGAHRSGTTFLYDSLAKCFPVANLDLYHIFYYHRILSNYVNNSEAQQRAEFNQFLAEKGITDRGLDGFQVSDRMVEEYCWVLSKANRVFPASKTDKHNWQFLKQVCQKVLYTTPEAKGILLKNPFDYTRAEFLLQCFPEARFVYIKRKPSEILNSSVNAAVEMSKAHPFFELMRTTQPSLSHKVSDVFARAGHKVKQEQLINWTCKNLSTYLPKQLDAAKASLQTLPRDRYRVVDYHDFMADPTSHLQDIQTMMGMEFSCDPSSIVAKPRQTELLPEVQKYAAKVDAHAW